MDTSLAGSVSQMLSRILSSLHLSHTQNTEQNEPEEPRRQIYASQNLPTDTGCQCNSHFFTCQSQDTSEDSDCPYHSQSQFFEPPVNTEYQSHNDFFESQRGPSNTQLFGPQRVVTFTEQQPDSPENSPSDSSGQSYSQYSPPQQNIPSDTIYLTIPPPQPVTFTESEILESPKPLFGNPGQSVFSSGMIDPRLAGNSDPDFPVQNMAVPNQMLESNSFLNPSSAIKTQTKNADLPSNEFNPSENLEFGVFQRPIPAVHVIPGPDFDEESLYVVKNKSDQTSLVDWTNSPANVPQVCVAADKKYFQSEKNNVIQKPLAGDQFKFISKSSMLGKPSENDIFSKNRKDKLFA